MAEKPLRVVAVCGCGMGSSVILKMNADKALAQLQIKAIVEVADATTAKGAARGADLIIVSKELASLFKDTSQPVITLTSFVNKNEILEKLAAWKESIQKS